MRTLSFHENYKTRTDGRRNDEKNRINSNIKKWRFDWKKIALMKRHWLNVDESLKSLGCCVQVECLKDVSRRIKTCFKTFPR